MDLKSHTFAHLWLPSLQWISRTESVRHYGRIEHYQISDRLHVGVLLLDGNVLFDGCNGNPILQYTAIKYVHHGFNIEFVLPNFENNSSNMRTFSSLSVKIAHLLSVPLGQIFHCPVHNYKNALIVECTESFFLGLLLIESSKHMRFPIRDCLQCRGHLKCNLTLLIIC